MTVEQPARRTQGERTAISRRRILDAAVELLYSQGYSSATTLRIQQEAGVSRGRLLHQFPSREDLLIAAVDHLVTTRIENLTSRTEWPEDPEERIAEAIETMWSTYHQPYFWASTELWLAARSNGELRRTLLPQERRVGRMVRETSDSFFGPDLCAHPNYLSVRELLSNAMRGVALTYALEPRDHRTDPHLDVWIRISTTLLLP